MAGARAYECVYCHDLDRSHAINDVTKKKLCQNLQGVGHTYASWHQHTQFFGTLCQPRVPPTRAPSNTTNVGYKRIEESKISSGESIDRFI